MSTIQIIRHRATRRSVFGHLYFGDLELFTLERRSDMLETGSYVMQGLMIGDHPVTGDSRKEGRAGFVIVGIQASRYSLQETGNAMEKLKKELAAHEGAEIHVEVIDDLKYTEVE